jgi:hypothetical protein
LRLRIEANVSREKAIRLPERLLLKMPGGSGSSKSSKSWVSETAASLAADHTAGPNELLASLNGPAGSEGMKMSAFSTERIGRRITEPAHR